MDQEELKHTRCYSKLIFTRSANALSRVALNEEEIVIRMWVRTPLIRLMSGVSMKDRKTSEELRRLVGVEPITTVIRG